MPDPLPVAIVIHDTRDIAVHAHPAREVTVTEPDPPVAATSAADGAMAYVHGAGDGGDGSGGAGGGGGGGSGGGG